MELESYIGVDDDSVCSWQLIAVALGMRYIRARESRGTTTIHAADKISATPNAFGDLLFRRREAGRLITRWFGSSETGAAFPFMATTH